MKFGTGSTTKLTQKREGQSTKMPSVRPYIIGERDTYRGNTIENRGCLFIYVWTYVCHFVL